MAISLWYQSGVDFSQHPRYAAALKKRFMAIAATDARIDLYGTSEKYTRGIPIADRTGSPYAYLRTYVPLFTDAARAAHRDGYDAFIVGTLSEPLLRELRSVSILPVVSALECSLLTACTVASRFAVVTLNSGAIGYIQRSVAAHALGSRVSGVYAVPGDPSEDDLETSWDTSARYVDTFVAAARGAVSAGAEAVIPGEGLLAALLAEQGIDHIDRASVIDPVAVSLLFAEYSVQLRRRTGLEASRRAYPLPTAAVLDAFPLE